MFSTQDQLLHTLTPPQLAAARPRATALDGRMVELEIAAWLHLPGLSDLPVSLLISYRDGDQQREISIDHGRIDPQQRILLSGVARLPVKQKLEGVELRLRSAVAPQTVKIEEIFIQPIASNLN
ncbi:hypothetical protein ACFPTX_14575 [Pseudomonas sp. GCM10022188]|uniref:hypothetical protein n=1 Tax=Pseudomonas TaxID=286 RepID=UPI001E4B4762|nr:hypothetical protein [Pseudomonas oryzagri]MCC6076153.1 hypothetical protein [Pseudomonas oryzagri]